MELLRAESVEAARAALANGTVALAGGTDLVPLVRDRIVDLPRGIAVQALVEAPAADVRSRIGRWATVEDDGPRRCRVFVDADNLDWPATALAMTGADFTVVSPPELRDHLRDMGRRCTAAAGPAI